MLTERALQFAAIKRENSNLKRTLSTESEAFGIIGRTPKMRQVYETIRATARSEASVLIEGESGTGKELIATAFHYKSSRADGPVRRHQLRRDPARPDRIGAVRLPERALSRGPTATSAV